LPADAKDRVAREVNDGKEAFVRALLAMLLVGVAAFMSMPAARAAEIGLEGIGCAPKIRG